jgi:integrase
MRGVRQYPDGRWAIRYACGFGHLHKQIVGRLKSIAERAYHERKQRAHREPGWCPALERTRLRRDAARQLPFHVVATDYLAWSKTAKRSWRTDASRIPVLIDAFGDLALDAIQPLDVERFRDRLLETRSRATANRYRALLSSIYKRACRDGAATRNPVTPVPAFQEPGGRIIYATELEEAGLLAALWPRHRPLFVISVHTGLRWSEERALHWQDCDMLTGTISVPRSKHGKARVVPMNATVRSVLLDLATQRTRPGDPRERVFPHAPAEPAHFFPRAVKRALAAMQAAQQPAPHLPDYTWHGNRHTFTSRLVMSGVDLRTVQELGGWKTFAMVARYAHLAPGHLQAAVDRLVDWSEVSQKWPDPKSVGPEGPA